MRRDELVDRLRALPVEADVGVKVGGAHVDIVDVIPWGEGQFGAVTCRPRDLQSVFIEWGLSAEQRTYAASTVICAHQNGKKAENMTRQQLRLAGIDEVRALLGATEQQAEDLVSSAGFPQPLATLDAGRVWDLDDIDRWRTTHNDTPPTEDN